MAKDVGEELADAALMRTRLHGSTVEASYAGAGTLGFGGARPVEMAG